MRDELKPTIDANRDKTGRVILAVNHLNGPKASTPAPARHSSSPQDIPAAKTRREIESEEPERWDGLS
jgi:hypothetical protein